MIPKQHSSFRVARLLAELNDDTRRVWVRKDRPTWTNHPRRIDLVLFATDELSVRETIWMLEHFTGCIACQGLGDRFADRIILARSSREAVATAREFIREGRYS